MAQMDQTSPHPQTDRPHVDIPFGSTHAAMGVAASFTVKARHHEPTDTVTLVSRRRNIVTFTGEPADLANYIERLNARGILSPFVFKHAIAGLRDTLVA